MKYNFSILVPHSDDEFIGCRKLIQSYGSHIDNIIYITNGEYPVCELPDMISYITVRRQESESWVKNILHHVNFIILIFQTTHL